MTRTRTQVMLEFIKAMKEAQYCAYHMLLIWNDIRWGAIREALFDLNTFLINKAGEKVALV